MASFRCYDNSDLKPYDKFSSISNKTMVTIFPNVCLWRRSYAQNWEVLTLKNCYSIEPPSYASTAYVVASFGLVSFLLFRKNLGNLREFFGQIVYRPPWQKIARTPMEAKCTTFLVEMSFICMRMKNHYHNYYQNKGCALNLVLMQRPGELGSGLH